MSRSSNDLFAPNDEYEKTISVSGIPEGVTQNNLWIHFQKKKNGGGEVVKVTLLTGGKAVVVFEDAKVAKVAVNTEQKLKGNVLEVKRLEKENVEKINKEGAVKKEARTVSVSGLPDGVTENNVFIHFQKKKNGGGEVEKVQMLGEGKAIVVFEVPEVAKKVVATEQIIKGNVVDVKLVEEETYVDEETSGKSGTSEHKSGTVLVSGLPERATENAVHIHFQKTKNGGGDILKVNYFPEKKEATVVFEDLEVAKRVVDREQVFQGKLLDVKLQCSETNPTIEGSGEDSTEKARTIVVSDLPEGATENNVCIHFQKKRNGGGEIEKVTLLPGNAAVVVFQNPEVAKRVVDREQVFQGKLLDVKLQCSETNPTIEESGEDSTEKARTILVCDLPEGATENNVCIHFQKKRNGGGEIEKVTLLPGNAAVVVFQDPEVASRIVTSSQEMNGKVLTVSFLNIKESPPEVSSTPEVKTASEVKMPPKITTPEVTTLEVTTPDVKEEETTTPESVDLSEADRTSEAELEMEKRRQMEERATAPRISPVSIDPVFSMVTATVNPVLMSTASQDFWSIVFNVIQSSCGVHCQPSAYGVLLTGSLSQVTRAGEILGLKWKKQCQGLNQSDTNFVQHGTALNHVSTNVNQSSTYVNPSGTDFNQIGAQFNQADTILNENTTHFNTTKSMGSSQEFVSGGLASDGSLESRDYQQEVHKSSRQRYQQQGGNWEGQRSNDRDPRWENNYTSEFGTPGYNQHLHPDRNVRCVYQPSGAKQSGFAGTNVNPQPFDNPPNTQPKYAARFPSADEKEHVSTKPQRSDDSTKNPQPIGKPPQTRPKYAARTPSADEKEHVSTKPQRSDDSTKNPQPIGKPPNTQPEYAARSPSANEREHVGTKPQRSDDSTKNPQPIGKPPYTQPEYAARSPSANEREHVGTKPQISDDSTKNPEAIGNPPNTQPKYAVVSLSTDEKELVGTKPPRLDDSTKNPQPFDNPLKRPPATITEGDQANGSKTDPTGGEPGTSPGIARNFQPLENGQNNTTDSARGEENKTPKVHGAFPSGSTTGLQTPVNDQHTTTRSPSTEPERSTMSNDKTDDTSAKAPTLPPSTTNHQPPDIHPESRMLNTANEAETLTTSSVPFVPSNELSDSRNEKPPGFPENSIKPQPTGSGDQRDAITEPNTEAQINSSEQTGPPSSQKSTSLTGKQPHSPDHTRKLQPPHNDQLQQGITSNTTTGSQNSTTSGNQIAVPSAITAGSVIDKPYNAVEKTLNNRPQHNQGQTTPKQQTSAPENTNTESSDKPPDSKMPEEPHSLTEQTPNSNGKPQKRTPVPRPRQNKPGTGEKRQNAANFSSSVKATQARQGNSSPTESNNNSTNDKLADTTNPNKEGDQIAITKNEDNDTMLDELD